MATVLDFAPVRTDVEEKPMNWIPETGIALGHRRRCANDATDLCTLGYELVESRNHPHGSFRLCVGRRQPKENSAHLPKL